MEAAIDPLLGEYQAMARILVQMLRPVLAADPTRECIETCLENTVHRMVKVSVSAEEGERTLASPIYGVVLQSYLDVVMNNPMYGSHALVMQWDVAIDRRMKEFFDKLKQKRNERERPASTDG
jgi:hypothetical protein